MIEEVETGAVMFSDITYPTEYEENKRYLLIKTSSDKDLLSSDKTIVNLTIICRFINKGSNKIVDVLKSQSRYRVTVKYKVSIEELYTKVYLHAMENFIKSLKEKDVNNDILHQRDLIPLSIADLQPDLIDLREKINTSRQS